MSTDYWPTKRITVEEIRKTPGLVITEETEHDISVELTEGERFLGTFEFPHPHGGENGRKMVIPMICRGLLVYATASRLPGRFAAGTTTHSRSSTCCPCASSARTTRTSTSSSRWTTLGRPRDMGTGYRVRVREDQPHRSEARCLRAEAKRRDQAVVTYDDAVRVLFKSRRVLDGDAVSGKTEPSVARQNMPCRETSECVNGNWYLMNENGRVAIVGTHGKITL